MTFADARPTGDYALILPIRKGEAIESADLGLDAGTVEALARTAKGTRFEGENGKQVEVFTQQDGEVRRIVLVGIGSGSDEQALEKAGGAVVGRLMTSGETRLVFDPRAVSGDAAASRLAFGALQRSWRHDVHRTKMKDKSKPTIEEIVGIAGEEEAQGWTRFENIYAGIALTRELVTEPPNVIYPESFVERCRELEDLGVEITVLDKAQMKELGMGALLGVAQGSAMEPQLLVMHWKGGDDGSRPVAFVGKGVTFDSGGISIKPGAGMEDMKFDMGGAGAVAGAMRAIAGRKAKANVIGICGLVENMPSGTAQRPSDIVTTMSGQTVEVLNTDAEGRLVLADALTWVQREHKPQAIVDLATLTGAMIIALGHEHAGCFSNSDSLTDNLMTAARNSGDSLWRMPLGKAYDKLLDSPIADMKNVGPREAGSITAAQFLQRFIENDTPWAHLDIAGTAWIKSAAPLREKGATGFGVRLLDRLIADNYEA